MIKIITRKMYLLLFFIAAALEAYPLQQTFRRYSLPSFVRLPNRLGRYLDHPPSLGLQDAATVSPQPLFKESLEKHKQKEHKNLKMSSMSETPEITLEKLEKLLENDDENLEMSPLNEESEFALEGLENLWTNDNVNNKISPLIKEPDITLEELEKLVDNDDLNHGMYSLSEGPEIIFEEFEKHMEEESVKSEISTLIEDSQNILEELEKHIGKGDENLKLATVIEGSKVTLEDLEKHFDNDIEKLKISTLTKGPIITKKKLEEHIENAEENLKMSTLIEDSEIPLERSNIDENLITAHLIEELEVPLEDSEEYIEKDQENLKTSILNESEITLDEFEKKTVTDQEDLKISTLPEDSEITFENGIEDENLTTVDLIEELRLQITLENLKEQKETNQKTLNTSTLNEESEITLEEFKEHLDKDQDNLQTSSRYKESMTSLEKHLKKDHKLEESETQVKKDDDDDDILSGESKIIPKVSEMNIYNVDEMTTVLIDELEVPWEISENPLDTEDENTKTQYLIKDSEIMLEELKKKFETLPVMEEHLKTKLSPLIAELENTLNAFGKDFENENFTPPTLRRELKITVDKSTESSNMKTSTDEKMVFSVLLSVFDT